MKIPKQSLQRLPEYLNYLNTKKKEGLTHISSPMIASGLKLNDVQVRKDIALVSKGGKPKIGYQIDELISDIRYFLGYDNVNEAILIGAGRLGKALMSYEGFKEYGLNIVAAFDKDDSLVGTVFHNKQIFSIEKIPDLSRRLNIHIGIITVPTEEAQGMADLLVESGIKAIWNFAPIHLEVPDDIIVQNENMALSLAILSNHLTKRIKEFQ